jgi:hypothetical protein
LDSQGEVQGVYSLQAAVEDYQEVYDKAVEVYYAFEDAQIAELQSVFSTYRVWVGGLWESS